MNDQQVNALLEVAEKASVWLDNQKKMTKLIWLILIIPIVSLGFFFAYLANKRQNVNNELTSKALDWYDVQRAERTNDLSHALWIATQLMQESPMDFEGHYKRGILLLKTGNRSEALSSFRKAHELFPIATYKEAVTALETSTSSL